MALPQQVIDRLSREPAKTPGWSFGLLLFSGGIFFIAVITWLGLAYGYTPYLQNQLSTLSAQVDTVAKTISPDDQATLVSYYSEISNVRTVLQNHVIFSRFLSWLEAHTETNVYFSRLSFASGSQINLTGIAKTENDANQQMAIFEAAPEVKSAAISTVALQENTNSWQFGVTLNLDPTAVLRMASAIPSAATSSATTK